MRKLLRLCPTSNSHIVAFSRSVLLGCFCLALCAPALRAQSLQVLHAFTGESDGIYPESSLTFDRAGNLYGTTYGGRGSFYGSVYELMRHNSSWIFKTLYTFRAQNDGQNPESPVIFGPDGLLYGATPYGGYTNCFGHYCGTVYNVQPPARACANVSCPWNENAVYWFGQNQINDGFIPGTGPLVFDSAGNLYGTTQDGGLTNNGIVFQLFRTQGGWGENILYNFPGEGGIAHPQASVTLDSAGNLYGTVMSPSHGAVYKLVNNGGQWTEQTLYSFQGGADGNDPEGGVIFDSAGNLYGTTAGVNNPATVFQLSPQTDGTWRETVLHVFSSSVGPKTNLAMDSAGNLYGTTQGLGGGDQFGMVFKLSRVNGSWTFTTIYQFTNGTDGAYPVGGVTVDAAGNLYGTCAGGGANGYGTVWEITP